MTNQTAKPGTARALMLPSAVPEVTSEWLTAAVATRWPGAAVTGLRIDTPIEGTATKIPVRVEYNDVGRRAGLPAQLMIKGAFGGHQFLETVAPLFMRETRFYRDIAPWLDINTPRCLFAGLCTDPPRGLVALEDITSRRVTFGHMTRPIGPDSAAGMLDILAQVHASSWDSPDIAVFGQWPDFIPHMVTDEPGSQSHWAKERWEASMDLPYASTVPVALHDFTTLRRALTAMWEANAAEPQCLIHGDAHLGNTFFEQDGSPGLLDWQMTMSGPASVDLAEFLVSALDIEVRRKHEQPLIRHYLDRLGSELSVRGIDTPGFDDIWLAYRRNILYSVLWVAIPEQMQPVEVNAAGAIRACAAASDLDTLGALGVGSTAEGSMT